MSYSYDLTKLGPEAFENLVNFLMLKTLGLGSTGFGPGADGGRDGYFEGEAPYPSETDRWRGTWYIQCKFHKPHLSTDPQKWIINQVRQEIKEFESDETDRFWPDNWIIATNIDQSGKPETGSFDAIRKLVVRSRGRKTNVHVWGGKKILDLLALNGDAARYYGHLLTPGHVISALYEQLSESRASIAEIIRYFVVSQFSEHMFTKLDQAGSSTDVRPGVHDLFIDLPYSDNSGSNEGYLLSDLSQTSAQCHRYSLKVQYPNTWRDWNRFCRRARVVLVKGGPGQGKSTIGQYLCQINRASLILSDDGPPVVETVKSFAAAVREFAVRDSFWPTSPRIPIQLELKEFAHWYSQRAPSKRRDILSYLAEVVSRKIGCDVLSKTIKSALSKRSWIVIFDGLDEVPNDVKDLVANEVMHFLNDVIVEIDADVLSLCTSRPQGYSGQFSGIDGPVIDLKQLDAETAMRCAEPLLKFGRGADDAEKSIDILRAAAASPSVKELMTTPLQAHIMAVVVRDGGRPPERRWALFNSFYLVMKKRESMKNFPNPRIAKLLREEDRLLKSVHMRLGFVLHARAERSEGAQTTLSKIEFRKLVRDAVCELVDMEVEETVDDVMEATTERLVLVSTPESGQQVRFDIRQLQEFFAAEFLYAGVDPDELGRRISIIGGDEHWREVVHFLISALIENFRTADVAVAVEELRRLNEGTEGGGQNLYRRRVAKGALLAGRLLMEGVLEQDQRDRHRLRPLFDPLGAIFDIASLRPLANVRPPRSRLWLMNELLEKVAATNSHEHVGALFLLAWLLPLNHKGEAQALSAILNASVDLQEVLFELWAPDGLELHFQGFKGRESVAPLGQWVYDAAISILNSKRWTDYTPNAIEKLFAICSFNSERVELACRRTGFDDQLPIAVRKFLESKRDTPPTEGEVINCGLLDAIPFPENWSNGRTPKRLEGIEAERLTSHVGGALKLMMSCLWYAQSKGSSAAVEALREQVLEAGELHVGTLPGYLLALVPIDDRFSGTPFSAARLYCSERTESHIEKRPPFRDVLLKKSKRNPSDDDWKIGATNLPQITANFAFCAHDGRYFPWIKDVKFVPELKQLLLDNPVIAVRHILQWGSLSEQQADLLAELKEKVACALPFPADNYWGPLTEIYPFKLVLPHDLPLLSVLAPQIISWHSHIRAQSLHSNSSTSLGEVLTQYGLSAESLRQIAVSSENSIVCRAGALAMYWINLTELNGEHCAIDLTHEQSLYRELRTIDNQSWLTRALVVGVLGSFSETSSEALAIVTDLLELCGSQGGPRRQVTELLRMWSARSTEPTHTHGVLDTWLGYNFEPPSYARA